MPSFAPGKPTFSKPVRNGLWPVMNAARPAVQDLLAIPVGEQRAFLGDAVNVGRLVAHHAAVIATRVVPADVVAPEDEDVGFLALPAVAFSRLSAASASAGTSIAAASTAAKIPAGIRFMIFGERLDLSWADLVAVEKILQREGGRPLQAARMSRFMLAALMARAVMTLPSEPSQDRVRL